MKKKKDGRQHSRRTVKTVPLDKLDALFTEDGRQEGGKLVLGQTFSELSDDITNRATAILLERGLPNSPHVYMTEAGWQSTKPSRKDFQGYDRLDSYVTKQGYPRDSDEDLAARIIVAAELMRTEQDDSALYYAYTLGRLFTLLGVYRTESNRGRRGGGSRKRKHWAEELAATLRARNPEGAAKTLINSIPEESYLPLSITAWEIYRDDYRVFAANDKTGKEESLSLETFRTKYLNS